VVGEVLGDGVNTGWGGRKEGWWLTVPAYPAFRKPVPPSRTEGGKSAGCSWSAIAGCYYRLEFPPCFPCAVGLLGL